MTLPKAGSWGAWMIASRPKTLGIAAVPVIVAAFWVYAQESTLHIPTLILMILCAVLIQVITNLQNDVGYLKHSAVKENATDENTEIKSARVGMPRATELALLTEKQARDAIKACVAVTLFLGIPLVLWHGVVVIIIGALSIITAIWYMAGKRPLAFTPYGELFVFIFFGLIAVNGAVYLLTYQLSVWSLLLSIAIGSLASSVLLVNNYRDLDHDRNTGRVTLAVALGKSASQKVYALMILAPFGVTLMFAFYSTLFLLPMFALPLAIRTLLRFVETPTGESFNAILLSTVRLEVLYGALFCAAGFITGMIAATQNLPATLPHIS